jgi:hypothetical protein
VDVSATNRNFRHHQPLRRFASHLSQTKELKIQANKIELRAEFRGFRSSVFDNAINVQIMSNIISIIIIIFFFFSSSSSFKDYVMLGLFRPLEYAGPSILTVGAPFFVFFSS